MTAIDLAKIFGTTPEFWLNLQQAWDLDKHTRCGELRSIAGAQSVVAGAVLNSYRQPVEGATVIVPGSPP